MASVVFSVPQGVKVRVRMWGVVWALVPLGVCAYSSLVYGWPRVLGEIRQLGIASVALLCVLLISLVLASRCFSRGRRIGQLSVEAGTTGIRMVHTCLTCQWLAWSDITEIRERPAFQRLDLTSDDRTVCVSLDYELEGLDELLAMVATRARCNDSVAVPQVFSARLPAFWLAMRVFHSEVASVFGAIILSRSPFLGAALIVVPNMLLMGEVLAQLRHRTGIDSDHLSVRSGLRTSLILFSSIKSLTFAFRKDRVRMLNVVAVLRDGDYVPISPLGCDVFRVYRAAREALSAVMT
jgi:hypothetical protein